MTCSPGTRPLRACALADFLEANPAVPVNEYGETFHMFTRTGDDASAAALVDQVADLLGVTVIDDRPDGGHYIAEKTFGRASYRIVHIPERQKRDHQARASYRDNIVLGSDQATRDDQHGHLINGRVVS
ncbi:hypothetical protein ACQPZP_06660 [Spirillospora sp. CA-142024]|uniref:hypothetical protein n=1 Tax=Spirillospora sp. CA-142024 TaxID=3240036 RepID=UPI003D8ACF3F